MSDGFMNDRLTETRHMNIYIPALGQAEAAAHKMAEMGPPVQLGTAGVKHDTNKLRYDLVPWYPMREVARVYTIGAVKYGDHNYLKGMKWMRVFAAIMRHLWAWASGETHDKESGLHHGAHAAWGCLTLIEYDYRKIGEDDRALHQPNVT